MERQVLERQRAIARYENGERPSAICRAMGRSREWFYKWLTRYQTGGARWADDASRRPRRSPRRVAADVETAILTIRRSLVQRHLFCGAQAIAWELAELGVQPPSVRTINRVLERHGRLTPVAGRYVPKGRPYPALLADVPGRVHQTDFVGPCYLAGPIRFYSLHSVDVGSARCGIEPVLSRSSQPMLDAIWAIWSRLGVPTHQQVDNEMVFYGSRTYPRGMGPLIRLCLAAGVQLWFIPPGEPWRNGVVEKFNDIWQQHGPLRRALRGRAALRHASLAFEQQHNAHYRYSKLGGKTPNTALAASGTQLRFPDGPTPRHPLPKPETGRYHLVRYVRQERTIDLFGETFVMPPEAVYTYIRATIDVARQRLSIVQDGRVIDEHRYRLR
jgi:putative transposase